MKKNAKTGDQLIWGEDPELFGPKDWFRNSILIGELRKRITTGKILDYGCGSGTCVRRLSGYEYDITGIDITAENVRYLKGKLKSCTNVHIYLGDERKLKEIHESFDAILCGETLEHIRDDVRLIKLFHTVLKPAGYVILSVPAHMARWSPIDEFAGHFRRYEKEELYSKFARNGFTIEKIWYWGFPLGVIWDREISDPIMRNKMEKKVVYTNSQSLSGFFMQFNIIKKILSAVFFFDSLFFYNNKRGNGLFLVARKKT